MTRKRVLVACFWFEVNSFVAGETTLDDYRAQTFAVGQEIKRDVLGPDSEFAAAWDVLEEAGCDIIPSVVAWASAGPKLQSSALEEIITLALEPCDSDVDGAYFALFGAAATPDDDDADGTFLAAFRDRLGRDRPIAVSLDNHAHLTARMVESADVITAYRTCPHTDLARTGAQAASILVDTLAGRVRPVCAMATRPMITPADLHDSSREPFRQLMSLCESSETGNVLAAALLPVTPWVDLPGIGWKAVVTTDNDPEEALRVADQIVAAAWDLRHAFLTGERWPIDDALAQALRGPTPCVLADAGDCMGAGSDGDSTELLRSALRFGRGARVLLSIRDPDAATLAHHVGEGAMIDVILGSGPEGAYNAAVPVTARVRNVFDGEFRYTHPAIRGYRATTGLSARLEIGPLQVVVHTRKVFIIDPSLYFAVGADPATVEIIQAKSQVSFRAGFSAITERSVVADTEGPTSANLTRLPFSRRPHPLFPFEDAGV